MKLAMMCNKMKEKAHSNRSDFIVGLLGLITGLIVLFILVPHTIKLPPIMLASFGFYRRPDIVPQLWAIFIILMSIGVLLGEVFFSKSAGSSKTKQNDDKVAIETYFYMGALVFVMFGFLLLLERIGFIFTSILCLAALLRIFGNRNILVGSLISVSIPLVIFFTLTRFVGVSLP